MGSDYTHRLIDGEYYVRITHMLSQINAKGKQFEDFLKNNGRDADRIAKEAAQAGTNIHKACEMLIKDKKIATGDATYPEYKKVLGFKNWVHEYSPEFLETEKVVHDDFCSGRFDFSCKIGDTHYIVDIKTGKGLYFDYYVQLAFYAYAYGQMTQGTYVPALLWLKDTTKKGFQFVTFTDEEIEKYTEAYECCKKLYEIRGLPTEPKREYEIPKYITLEE